MEGARSTNNQISMSTNEIGERPLKRRNCRSSDSSYLNPNDMLSIASIIKHESTGSNNILHNNQNTLDSITFDIRLWLEEVAAYDQTMISFKSKNEFDEAHNNKEPVSKLFHPNNVQSALVSTLMPFPSYHLDSGSNPFPSDMQSKHSAFESSEFSYVKEILRFSDEPWEARSDDLLGGMLEGEKNITDSWRPLFNITRFSGNKYETSELAEQNKLETAGISLNQCDTQTGIQTSRNKQLIELQIVETKPQSNEMKETTTDGDHSSLIMSDRTDSKGFYESTNGKETSEISNDSSTEVMDECVSMGCSDLESIADDFQLPQESIITDINTLINLSSSLRLLSQSSNEKYDGSNERMDQTQFSSQLVPKAKKSSTAGISDGLSNNDVYQHELTPSIMQTLDSAYEEKNLDAREHERILETLNKDLDSGEGFRGLDGVWYKRPDIDAECLKVLNDINEFKHKEGYYGLFVEYCDGVNFPLGEGGRELLRVCLNAKGCKGRRLQGASVPRLLKLAKNWDVWNVAIRIRVERATGDLCAKHKAFVRFKSLQSHLRKFLKRETMHTERDGTGQITDIRFEEMKSLTLGKDGREKLRTQLRRLHSRDPHLMDSLLRPHGFKYSELRNATVPQLLKMANICGMWDEVIKACKVQESKKDTKKQIPENYESARIECSRNDSPSIENSAMSLTEEVLKRGEIDLASKESLDIAALVTLPTDSIEKTTAICNIQEGYI